MKKLLCAFLALCLTLLTACGSWDDVSENADPLSELTEYYKVENEPSQATPLTSFTLPWFRDTTLDGVSCADGCQQVVGALLYESLYALDETFTPYAVLAREARYDPEALTYTITLQSGVTFSDGTPLTTQDVAATLQRARTSPRYAARLEQVKSIDSDDSAVIITLKTPNGGFLAELDIPIVRNDTPLPLYPLGTGPYCLARGESGYCLIRNENWWQDKTLPLQRIELMDCKSTEAMQYAFTARDVQLLCRDLTGSSETSELRGDYTDAATTTMQYLGFHMGHELLSRQEVRQAICLAVDRSRLTATYLLGHGTAAQFPVHPDSPLYPASLEANVTREDVDRAMADAGLSGGEERWALRLLVNSENSFKVAICQAIADTLGRYDLDVTVTALPWEEYLAALRAGDFDLYYGECRLTADWDVSALVATGGTLNCGGYSDEETDALLERYRAAVGDHRAPALESLCRQLQRRCPIAPVCFKSVSVLMTYGLADKITPTAADPFYGMENWVLHMESPEN